MDNKSTTKRMIGAVVLVLIAALLLAWLLKGKSRGIEEKNMIAGQTQQESSPILGFPGVNKDGQTVNEQGQLVAADGTVLPDGATQEGAAQEVAATQDGANPAVIGNPDEAAQLQAQNALNGQAQESADAGAAAGADTGGAGATVTAAVGEVVNAGKGVVQELATNVQPDTTGFQVRDPNGEVRQVVEDGKVADGVGSMGADVKTAANAAEQPAKEQQAAATEEAAGKADSGKKAATASTASGNAKPATTKANQQVAVSGGDMKPAKIANPRLVNERPVPAPAVQRASATSSTKTTATASTKTATSSNKATVSASSAASSKAAAPTASAAAGKDGYVIQVLATSNKGKADGVKASIAVDGYPAFIAQAKVDGKTVYRVRVGSYPGKNDAAAVQARMKVRYGENQYVQNSFVTQN